MIDMKTKTKAPNILQSSGLFVHNSLTPLKLNLTSAQFCLANLKKMYDKKTHKSIPAHKG